MIYTSSPFPTKDGLPLLSNLGKTRFTEEEQYNNIMPDYYRAPEVILKSNWDYKVDIWSIGIVVSNYPILYLAFTWYLPILEGLEYYQPQDNHWWQDCRWHLGQQSSYCRTYSLAWAFITRTCEKSKHELGFLGWIRELEKSSTYTRPVIREASRRYPRWRCRGVSEMVAIGLAVESRRSPDRCRTSNGPLVDERT